MMHLDYRLADKFNDIDYRCDDFKKNHDGKHILFIGDSFAAGGGLEKEETWCYRVYKKISEIEKTSGYFNLGTSGSAISDSIDQFFKYCYLYSNPDVVFFVTTEFNREERYGLFKEDHRNSFIYRIYLYLEQYCRSNNIKLYTFSWIKSINLKQPKRITKGPSWLELANSKYELINNHDILNRFETFYDYDKDYMMKKVFEYDRLSNNDLNSLWARDNLHPGTSFHKFYCDFIFDKYLIGKNNG